MLQWRLGLGEGGFGRPFYFYYLTNKLSVVACGLIAKALHFINRASAETTWPRRSLCVGLTISPKLESKCATRERGRNKCKPASEREKRDMPEGTVKWFNSQKGFGFIQPADGSKDVFVHISAVERAGMSGLNEGQRISFDLVTDRKSGKTSAGNLQAI
jgi:CspA family cold shock protein